MSEKISNRQVERAEEWMKERTRGRCPMCGGAEWAIDDELCSLPALQHDEPAVQLDRGYAMILVTCEECGFTAPFSAKKLGISA